MTKLTRISIMLAFFFGLDKIVGFGRLILVARQFRLTPEYDAFNVANNVPDLLFALISGGALAMAFIPVLTETLTKEGRDQAWDLFSRIANFAFLATGSLALIVALLADPLVRYVVAPGFTPEHQALTISLMRLDLIATLIFSISGLVMAGLQANQHFFLPALAPLLYNLGQITGALVLAPEQGFRLGPIQLPGFGMGIHGLVYGVVIGAVLHLLIQVPGLIRYHFHWTARVGLNTAPVRRVLALLGPRVVTMFLIQLTFIVRDRLASSSEGSVSALTLGYSIVQIPETLIGTAIGIAILPLLSEMLAKDDQRTFQATLQRATQVILAISLPLAVLLAVGLRPFLTIAFSNYTPEQIDLLLWTTRGFFVGLTGQCLVEVAVRSFYARRDAITPMVVAGINLAVYCVLTVILSTFFGAAGISLGDSLAFTVEALILLALLNRKLIQRLAPEISLPRALIGALAGGAVVALAVSLPVSGRTTALMAGVVGLAAGGSIALLLVWREVRLLLKL